MATEHQVLSARDEPAEWDRFVDLSPQGSVFSRSWWLQTVAPDRWEIHVLRQEGKIVCGLAAARSRARLHERLGMPPLTQVLGALLSPPGSDGYERNLTREMELLEDLVGRLPEVGEFSIQFHPAFTNWLPFYWAGYAQTTRYTYALEDLSDLEAVFSGFAHSKRKNLKRAEQTVRVLEDLEADALYDNHVATLAAQGKRIAYSRDLYRRILEAAGSRGAGKTWYAVDERGRLHAAILVVWDRHSAYYLISSIDPAHRNSGAATLLVRKAIEHVAPLTRRFDFEGSMIRGVETSFRRFGARQVPYFRISRDRRGALSRAVGFLEGVQGRLARRVRGRRPRPSEE